MKVPRTLLLLFLLLSLDCASYTMAVYSTKTPISFGNERTAGESYRRFRIEREMTWVLFDAIQVQSIDLDKVFAAELPGARKVINLRVTSFESGADSVVRVLGTGIQYLLATDRSLVSRRTLVLEGEVLE